MSISIYDVNSLLELIHFVSTSTSGEEEDTESFRPLIGQENSQLCPCPKSQYDKQEEADEREFQIAFENYLHNSVYVKR